jgi:4,5:9,10-diseco-3-hydroxy-5,9,17-trioxoandrosta-1(10),2-diene-4-oate hydrolase
MGAGMTRIQSRKVKIDDLNCHYLIGGQGDPLIIIHGGSSGASAWRENIIALSKHYTIYVPDLPGFGLSDPHPGNYYIPEMVEFIDKFAETLGLENFYLMGHSLGGGVALHYTLKNPGKIRKLVLVSSLCLGKEIAWWIRFFSFPALCRSIGRAAISVFRWIKYVARFFGPWDLVEPISRTSLQIGSCIANLTEQTIVLLSQLPKIMVPTLVVWGARDPIVPFCQAYTAAELIPDCRVQVFDKCGHSVYRERLKEFTSVLAGFLG